MPNRTNPRPSRISCKYRGCSCWAERPFLAARRRDLVLQSLRSSSLKSPRTHSLRDRSPALGESTDPTSGRRPTTRSSRSANECWFPPPWYPAATLLPSINSDCTAYSAKRRLTAFQVSLRIEILQVAIASCSPSSGRRQFGRSAAGSCCRRSARRSPAMNRLPRPDRSRSVARARMCR